MFAIQRIELPVDGLDALLKEASKEGHSFLDSLIVDWADGRMRYDGPGEGLFGVFLQGRLIAIGGLSVDPHAGRSDTGRLRKIFVRAPWRRQGVGETLVKALLAKAREGFVHVHLRAADASAARLYERLGFSSFEQEHATHTMSFEP